MHEEDNYAVTEVAVENESYLVDDMDSDIGLLEKQNEMLEVDVEVTEAHAKSVALLVENFEAKWNIPRTLRTLNREGLGYTGNPKLVKEDLKDTLAKGWEAFIRFLEDVADKIADTYRSFFNRGKKYLAFGKKAREALAKADEPTGTNLDKFKPPMEFVIDSEWDIQTCIDVARQKPADWESMINIITNTFNDTSMSFDILGPNVELTMKSGRFSKVIKAYKDGFRLGDSNVKLGKAANKKLSTENRHGKILRTTITALPGNNYVQEDLVEIPKYETPITFNAISFHKLGSDLTGRGIVLPTTHRQLSKSEILSHIGIIENLGNSIALIEKSHAKQTKLMRDRVAAIKHQNVSIAYGDVKGKDLVEALKTLSKESFKSSRATASSVTVTMNTLAAGFSNFVKQQMEYVK